MREAPEDERCCEYQRRNCPRANSQVPSAPHQSDQSPQCRKCDRPAPRAPARHRFPSTLVEPTRTAEPNGSRGRRGRRAILTHHLASFRCPVSAMTAHPDEGGRRAARAQHDCGSSQVREAAPDRSKIARYDALADTRLGGSSPHLAYFALSDVLRAGLIGPTLSNSAVRRKCCPSSNGSASNSRRESPTAFSPRSGSDPSAIW